MRITINAFFFIPCKAAVTHNEINESIATVKKTHLFVSLIKSHCTEILNELQSHCAKNGCVRFCCNDQSHCNEICV